MWRTFQYFDDGLCTCLLGLSQCGVCVFEYRVEGSLVKWVSLCHLRVRALCLCIFPRQGFGLIVVFAFLLSSLGALTIKTFEQLP